MGFFLGINTMAHLEKSNLVIFQEKSINLKEIIKVSYSWTKQNSSANNEVLEMDPQQSSKHSESSMVFFLNIGSAVNPVSSFSVVGRVIRDGKENWILSYNCFFGEVFGYSCEALGHIR